MSKRNKTLFQIAFYLNSTALVMPVLPFWWTEALGVSTEVYLSVLSLVSIGALLLDLPLSVLADRLGAKYTYMIGLGVFSFSFLITTFGNSPLAFYVYGISNTFAEGLISGSNNALLKDVVGENEYREEQYRLNHNYYLLTSIQFFIGVFLYIRAPRILMLIQTLMLLLACGLVAAISSPPSKHPYRRRRQTSSLKIQINKGETLGAVKFVAGMIALCTLLGYFNGLMQFQNRTIQLLSGQYGLGAISPLWTVALFLFLGNLLTSLGVGKRIESALSRQTVLATSLIFLIIAVLAGTLLYINTLTCALFGYMLICVLKGAYRAEYADVSMRTVPFSNWTARWLSIVNTAASLIGSGINLLIGLIVGTDLVGVQLVWSAAAILLSIICIPLLLFSRGASLPVGNKGMSEKQTYKVFNYIERRYPTLIQVYPNARLRNLTLKKVYESIKRNELRAALPLDSGVDIDSNLTKRSIEYVYYEAPNLSEIKPEERADRLNKAGLISDLINRKNLDSDQERSYIRSIGNANNGTVAIESDKLCSCKVIAHGDMNPGNILLCNGHYRLVDWDLSGVGPRALDEFSILFHPDVKMDMSTRVTLFRRCIDSGHDSSCPLRTKDTYETIKRLILAKIADCQSWTESSEANRLERGYQSLLIELWEEQEAGLNDASSTGSSL